MKSGDWKKTQERQLQDHALGAKVFSSEFLNGVKYLSKILKKYLDNKHCLDIGCGILPLPGYMKLSPMVKFTGIDPYPGDEHEFDFIQGYAELLPFRNGTFDGVLFATSIDHVENPKSAIDEACRVLKHNGYIIIWGTFWKDDDEKFILWQKTKDIKLFKHPHVFSNRTLKRLLKDFKLIETICITLRQKIFVFQKCLLPAGPDLSGLISPKTF